MSEIKVTNIETIFKKFIEKLKEDNITILSFDEDNYWNVPSDCMDSFPVKPELTVGSLDDDISFLNSLVDEDYSGDYLELERMASLLRFTSKKLIS